ncbi:MAG TPA: HAMP domain-containing sensor histidine kinase [Cyclobacteriaceae bacterium]
MKKTIRDFIIGKRTFIESWNEYKQVMLSGQFAILGILVCSMYLFIDLSWAVYQTIPVYSFAIGLLGISLYLHRKGEHCSANYFLFPTLNFVVYVFAASEGHNTGASLLFIPVALGGFAVFGYQQRIMALSFGILTFVLFIIAYTVDFSILPERLYTDDERFINFIINFTAAFPASILAIYLLISMNHHNAQELLATNKMLTKSNGELDRFVYSTSHDLRAPLASVLGLISLSERSNDMEEIKRYLGMMNKRVNSLESFIKDITDYSRNNRLQINFSRVNLYSMAFEVWESLRYSLGAEDINFSVKIDKDFEVDTDASRLQTILSNLISNAIRYHDHRKENKYIQLSCQQTEGSFSLHIEDNGQGIDPMYQKRIFEMFFRANESSQGSGLGLYIVKETINKLSGSIQLQSIPRVGSTFTVNLPKH